VRKWWKWRRRSRSGDVHSSTRIRPPLREFVYLDDVSLRSLLASQKGELTDQVTLLLSQADEAELASSIGASSPVLKAEIRSRYQTTISQGSQTSRKAVAQSLFKELRELEWINIAIKPRSETSDIGSVEYLLRTGTAVVAADLHRGALVEVEVELVADPIFRFSTIASELTEMARDFPELLDQPGAREGLAMLMPGNRFLQRFLAGLVPIRARATSHAVVQFNGTEHVVPTEAATALRLAARPLYVVGVTEQGSYWRDVRRVLFSGSRFTMLCRVARDGLWDSWEPVKLSDVLKEVLPTFPDLLADIGRTGLAEQYATEPTGPAPIGPSLQLFIDAVEAASEPSLSAEAIAAAREVASNCGDTSSTTTGQNEAFRAVIAELDAHGCKRTGDEWLKLVQEARSCSGLVLFDQPQRRAAANEALSKNQAGDRLLDTEIIAIYW